MGLLDGMLGNVLGGMLGGGQQQQNPQGMLLQAVMGMLSNNGQQGAGGLGSIMGALGGGGAAGAGAGGGALGGLLQAFQQSGMGDHAQSWVGTGSNMPISAEQVMQALGGGTGGNGGGILGQLAQQTGMSHEETAGSLSQMLPDIINHLTPNGQVPQGGIDDAMGMLSGLLKR